MASKYTDPVCGMEIQPGTEAATSLYQAETYFFCSMECMEKFENQPEEYANTEE